MNRATKSMLVSKEIDVLARGLAAEVHARPYLRATLPKVAEDMVFWRMLLEVTEIVLHKNRYVINRTLESDNPC
jgi:hypothetical protein